MSSLSLPAPSQLVLICTSEMEGRYLSSGKRTGAEPRPPRGQVGQQRFSDVRVAADAALLPEDRKEKAALREERTENTKLLQGQEEEEERLRDAGRAGTARIAQDVNIQVGRTGGSCWGQRLRRERVSSQNFPGSNHGLGSPVFGRRKGLGSG